jgi:multicomponent Na+:H+ antiporter subunit G
MMQIVQDIVGVGLVLLGLVFMALGSLGIVRLPDFFARMHAASKVDTVGIVVVLFGIAVLEGFTLDAGKVLVAAVFIMLTNPVAAHALARAALWQGIKPWRRSQTPPTPPKD